MTIVKARAADVMLEVVTQDDIIVSIKLYDNNVAGSAMDALYPPSCIHCILER